MRWLMAALAVGCGAAFAAAAAPAVAGADQLSQTFTTAGYFSLTAPQYAVRARITVQGASGTDGSASALGTNPGGTGGLGTVITGQVDVVGGESFGGFIGAAGGEPLGSAGDGDGGRGGSGGQFTLLDGYGSGDGNVPGFEVVAQGGGGGGGGGGAFFGQAGGNGGEGQFGFPTNGNGAAGSGVGGGVGGRHDPVGSPCFPETYIGSSQSAPPGSDAGGAGSAGGGFCPGLASPGGIGGGGGGGGAAGTGRSRARSRDRTSRSPGHPAAGWCRSISPRGQPRRRSPPPARCR